eukprot:1365143-Rhodomonas_salina.2
MTVRCAERELDLELLPAELEANGTVVGERAEVDPLPALLQHVVDGLHVVQHVVAGVDEEACDNAVELHPAHTPSAISTLRSPPLPRAHAAHLPPAHTCSNLGGRKGDTLRCAGPLDL